MTKDITCLTAPGMAAAWGEERTVEARLPLTTSEGLLEATERVGTRYALVVTGEREAAPGSGMARRLAEVAEATGAAIVYADYREERDGQLFPHPLIDYQEGSLRDDFDMGCAWLARTEALLQAAREQGGKYRHAALYAARLRMSRAGGIFHLPEILYTARKNDTRRSGERQFDYVDPRNREVQAEMEAACTAHLRAIGAYLPPRTARADASGAFPVEATVVIPVRNRARTIGEAINSALRQRTSFPFNVIVVDNHSTDGTGEAVERLAAQDKRVTHVIPAADDLGIGGCWMLAAHHKQCGRYAVQLDSDDLYAGEDTLERVVRMFREGGYGMVVGSYRMVNFQLKEIAPGIVDHREWTAENGHNNALRVNGLGAPRAFCTNALRRIGMPNTSYGEDYAAALAICREYMVGRIYEPIYLCRRWEGNSDADLDLSQENSHNLYKDRIRTIELLTRQGLNRHGEKTTAEEERLEAFFIRQLETWPLARKRYQELEGIKRRTIDFGEFRMEAQCNPARIGSATAKIDEASLQARACFLCRQNLPPEQSRLEFNDELEIRVNPFPIFERHFTVTAKRHEPQLIEGHFGAMLDLAKRYAGYTVFYNGPESGASAPDHFHFQLVPKGSMPLENDVAHCRKTLLFEDGKVTAEHIATYTRKNIILRGKKEEEMRKAFEETMKAMKDAVPGKKEAMMNLFAWRAQEEWTVVIFPRRRHRPWQFFAEGREHILFSPGCADFAGLIISPRQEDFERLDAPLLRDLFGQLTINEEEWENIVKRLQEKK